ncbi:MAG: DUF1015 domain-containing protein [Clostridia bacterium]|nr:DUF1015 domain-containing protein [Clostridia bacterium]
MYKKIAFYPADILLPDNVDMEKWAVIACDQFTSQPEYWEDVKNIVSDSKSAYNIVLPEIYLNSDDTESKIDKINSTMNMYINEGLFKAYNNTFFYIERKLSSGKIRRGIVGAIDLEQYEFEPGNSAAIRATEGTVLERIPPRIKVRENASLELPHVILLIDDEKDLVFSSVEKKDENKIYDFDLMKNSGHITAWNCDNCEDIANKFYELLNINYSKNNSMLFAVGDGNHSLATAKAYWNNIKKDLKDTENHPARFALVEVENVHDNALEFEPINRIILNCDPQDLLEEFKQFCGASEKLQKNCQEISYVINCKVNKLYIKNPASNLAVGTLQMFLDNYISKNKCEIDYIHGNDVVIELSKKENSIGFLLPSMEKSDLFKTIVKDGILPRKTFSMGEAYDKRFYIEARKIKTE